jgi:hypothetical protein
MGARQLRASERPKRGSIKSRAVSSTADEPFVSIGQVVNIGADLKRELQFAAQEENSDATWLARKILREWLAGYSDDGSSRSATAKSTVTGSS